MRLLGCYTYRCNIIKFYIKKKCFGFKNLERSGWGLVKKNTLFFYTKTMICRRRNKIEGINISGDVWCTDGDILMYEANNFFKNLFCPVRPQVRCHGVIPQGPSLSLSLSLPLSGLKGAWLLMFWKKRFGRP